MPLRYPASAYADAQVGPGALALEGSLEGFDVAAILVTLVREGCIGETVAAIEAAEALVEVRDAVVRTVLERIAQDELRHAELAWRTLGWLVASGRVCRSVARAAVVEGLATLTEPSLPHRTALDGADLGAFGVLGDARRASVCVAAASHVIAPCAAALLDRHGALPPPTRGIAACSSDRHIAST